MKCKCCKCYKEIEEKEQVKENHAVYCQDCHHRYRMYSWIGNVIVIAFMVIVFIWIFWYSNKKDKK